LAGKHIKLRTSVITAAVEAPVDLPPLMAGPLQLTMMMENRSAYGAIHGIVRGARRS
jgi:hypothetical protein